MLIIIVILSISGAIQQGVEFAHSTPGDDKGRRKLGMGFVLTLAVALCSLYKAADDLKEANEQKLARQETLNTCIEISDCINNLCVFAQSALGPNSTAAGSVQLAFANLSLALERQDLASLRNLEELGNVRGSAHSANQFLRAVRKAVSNTQQSLRAMISSNQVLAAELRDSAEQSAKVQGQSSEPNPKTDNKRLEEELAGVRSTLGNLGKDLSDISESAELRKELEVARKELAELETTRQLMAKDLAEWKRIHQFHLHEPLNRGPEFERKWQSVSNEAERLARAGGNQFASQINAMFAELKKQHELLAASDARIHEIDPLITQPEPPKRPAPPQNLRIVE